ncbi:hypothetical protein F4780DRAFT_401004 [Xylariomycetidae sp. FL0641]|nr:hypothetical protein F4780DRAFT_401004 [Xylariomycetidae sp. FL0641]
MARNGDIRGFFKPGSSQKSPSQSNVWSSQPPIDLPSSPMTPSKPTPKVLSRADEIKASDEEDEDSDDSLESISAMFGGGRKGSATPHRRDANIHSTPQAKRIAYSGIHKSPLTLQPKKQKHKFDLKALISHAQQDERTAESVRRTDELLKNLDTDEDDAADVSDLEEDPAKFQKMAKKLLVGEEDEAKGDKIVGAMKRNKVDGARRRCYFFKLEQPLVKPPRSLFPQRKAKGCWKCLGDPATRDQTFIHGLPHTIVAKGKALPDELFQWLLDEVCLEKNAQLRAQYSNLIALCSDQTNRLINDMQLYGILERMGGPKYAREHSRFESSSEVANPYTGRDWTGLKTFLQLLARIAPDLKTANAISAVQLLLRMSLDPIVASTVRDEHAAALGALVSVLPRSGRRWDTACEAICSYLYENTDVLALRIVPVRALPITSPRLLDLRRRLAAESLFGDPGLGSRPLTTVGGDGALFAESILARLDAPPFRIRHERTDYEELKAAVALLDIVVGDGGILRASSSSSSSSSSSPPPPRPQAPTPAASSSSPDEFDAHVDALTFRLKAAHDRIPDTNAVARKQAKADLDAVAKRLTYAVRSRPPPKTDIFDLAAGAAADGREARDAREEKFLPGQRAFMRNWAGRREKGNDAAAEAV